MEKYSKNYEFEGSTYRYNFEECLLEYVYQEEESGQYKMIDAIGLSKDEWEDAHDYWIEIYNEQLDQEFANLMEYEGL